mgnify:CR=1 FL=1
MTCECGHEHGIAGVTKAAEPGDLPVQPSANRFLCNCGCLELRERVVILEQALYQLSLVVENREKAKGEPEQAQQKKRWIGDKGENA